MRFFQVLFLVIGATSLAMPQSQKQPATNKQGPQKQIEKSAVNQTVPDTSRPGTVSETQFYTYNRQESERGETIKEISDVLLAIFTLALVWVGWQQWRTLRKHETWMEKNVAVVTEIASAAKKNADAIVDAERAWIIATPVQDAPDLGFIPDPGDSPETPFNDTSNRFSVSFKNTGNTPARLIDSAVVYRLFNSLDEVPSEPNYGQRGPFEGLPLVKGDSIGAIAFLQPTSIMARSQAAAVQRQEAFMCAYGIIAYEDVFGRARETRFGYVYHFPLAGDPRPRGFRRERLPSAYNRAT